jgi:alpha-mannosidase
MMKSTHHFARTSDRPDLSRRDFLIRGTTALGALAAGPAVAAPITQGTETETRVLHIIGQSHIDAAWLWPWRDGCNIVLTTLRSALDRINETPGFCFSFSSASYYRWVERADPAMFAEIQARVREKRWEAVGGWPVEPDCNIPSTESFVRHSLLGKEYFQRALGTDVRIAYNIDSFGHGAGLPTILKHAGYGYYVFSRPAEEEMHLPVMFWWEGPDGSRIMALRISGSYNGDTGVIRPRVKDAFAPGFNDAAFLFGVGDHGGATTKEQIRQILELRKDPSLPELRWSTLENFFAAAEKSSAFASLPVVKGELQHHSRGCYSAYGEGKILNRRAERWLVEAETISLAANRLLNHPYPVQEYSNAWWKTLFGQFHDLLAGTALYSDYQDTRDSVGAACDVAQTLRIEALETMARSVDMHAVKEGAVFLFNPLPWKRRAFVEYVAGVQPTDKQSITHLLSNDGVSVPVQWSLNEGIIEYYPRLSAWVDLPPCGYKVFELAHGEAPAPKKYGDFFKVSDTGFGISSLRAEDREELLSGHLGLVAISDTSDTWAHGITQFRQEMGRPAFISSTVIEDGPVIRITRQRAHWMSSEIVLDVVQYAGIDVVELRFLIDWHEHEQILKLEVPTALTSPRVFAKVPGQILERHANGQEEPYQDWAAVQGKIGNDDYTIALLNNSTYSYDCLNGLFRTILVRSAPFARHDPEQVRNNDTNAWQDQGRQERKFWLLGGIGTHLHFALDRRAEEWQTPAEYIIDSVHAGKEPQEQSFLEIMPGNVYVLAIKRAERIEDGTIIRLQERAGQSTQATLKSVSLGLDQTVDLAPWELKTLLVRRAGAGTAQVREVSLLET